MKRCPGNKAKYLVPAVITTIAACRFLACGQESNAENYSEKRITREKKEKRAMANGRDQIKKQVQQKYYEAVYKYFPDDINIAPNMREAYSYCLSAPQDPLNINRKNPGKQRKKQNIDEKKQAPKQIEIFSNDQIAQFISESKSRGAKKFLVEKLISSCTILEALSAVANVPEAKKYLQEIFEQPQFKWEKRITDVEEIPKTVSMLDSEKCLKAFKNSIFRNKLKNNIKLTFVLACYDAGKIQDLWPKYENDQTDLSRLLSNLFPKENLLALQNSVPQNLSSIITNIYLERTKKEFETEYQQFTSMVKVTGTDYLNTFKPRIEIPDAENFEKKWGAGADKTIKWINDLCIEVISYENNEQKIEQQIKKLDKLNYRVLLFVCELLKYNLNITNTFPERIKKTLKQYLSKWGDTKRAVPTEKEILYFLHKDPTKEKLLKAFIFQKYPDEKFNALIIDLVNKKQINPRIGIWILIRIGSKNSISIFEKCAKDKNPGLSNIAIKGLLKFGNECQLILLEVFSARTAQQKSQLTIFHFFIQKPNKKGNEIFLNGLGKNAQLREAVSDTLRIKLSGKNFQKKSSDGTYNFGDILNEVYRVGSSFHKILNYKHPETNFYDCGLMQAFASYGLDPNGELARMLYLLAIDIKAIEYNKDSDRNMGFRAPVDRTIERLFTKNKPDKNQVELLLKSKTPEIIKGTVNVIYKYEMEDCYSLVISLLDHSNQNVQSIALSKVCYLNLGQKHIDKVWSLFEEEMKKDSCGFYNKRNEEIICKSLKTLAFFNDKRPLARYIPNFLQGRNVILTKAAIDYIFVSKQGIDILATGIPNISSEKIRKLAIEKLLLLPYTREGFETLMREDEEFKQRIEYFLPYTYIEGKQVKNTEIIELMRHESFKEKVKGYSYANAFSIASSTWQYLEEESIRDGIDISQGILKSISKFHIWEEVGNTVKALEQFARIEFMDKERTEFDLVLGDDISMFRKGPIEKFISESGGVADYNFYQGENYKHSQSLKPIILGGNTKEKTPHLGQVAKPPPIIIYWFNTHGAAPIGYPSHIKIGEHPNPNVKYDRSVSIISDELIELFTKIEYPDDTIILKVFDCCEINNFVKNTEEKLITALEGQKKNIGDSYIVTAANNNRLAWGTRDKQKRCGKDEPLSNFLKVIMRNSRKQKGFNGKVIIDSEMECFFPKDGSMHTDPTVSVIYTDKKGRKVVRRIL